MKSILLLVVFSTALAFTGNAQTNPPSNTTPSGNKDCLVTTRDGILRGTVLTNGVRSFKGIPYAKPPVGPLRWKAPEPLLPWNGIRDATRFGNRPMQNRIYSDMIFRSDTISEDCLYLNVWTPDRVPVGGLPVLVYFYGGGFRAGDGSEPRYDGASMAAHGVVSVTVNYRLGVFGFLALPELTSHSPHHASGNYGLMDQSAALRWVKDHIAAFGGDPGRVTIAGQSAGSMSVSLQMASPVSRGLFQGAIGESGAGLGNLEPRTLRRAEEMGKDFMRLAGARNLAELRRIPAVKLLEVSGLKNSPSFGPDIDGYFLPESVTRIYSTGLQADVPLLAGWNSAEVDYHALLGATPPTPENFRQKIEALYGNKAPKVLRLYPGTDSQTVKHSATALASDRFIAYATWKWIDLHGKTDGKPVYRYLYAELLPPMTGQSPKKTEAMGAPHSAEIPYALGNLPLITNYQWTTQDKQVSAILQGYFLQFIRTGDPNGPGLPHWPGLQSSIPKVMVIQGDTKATPEKHQHRYLFLDQYYQAKP